jgi:hypothetical protein
MCRSKFRSLIRKSRSSRRSQKRAARRQFLVPAEILEDRLLLAAEVHLWDAGGATPDFSTKENWDDDIVPDSDDIANFVTTGQAQVFGYTQAVGKLNASSGADFEILLNSGQLNSQDLDVANATLKVRGIEDPQANLLVVSKEVLVGALGKGELTPGATVGGVPRSEGIEGRRRNWGATGGLSASAQRRG